MTDQLKGINLEDLDQLFGVQSSKPEVTVGGGAVPTKLTGRPSDIKGIDLSDLDAAFGGDKSAAPIKSIPKEYNVVNPDLVSGTFQGLKDIPNTGAQLIGAIDKRLFPGGEERAQNLQSRLETERASLPVDNTAFDVGRAGGQALATAPLMPVKAFQAIETASKALPYFARLV